MKELLSKIDRRNKWLIAVMGIAFFVFYLVYLYFRPQESWCDDAFWADWARQLAVHNRYYTTVWGSGQPTYCPLYVFIMAVWYKIVGFSFYAAQFPNICMTLITYWLLMAILVGRKHIVSWQGVVGISLLFWLSPSMFWIYNCGRIEVLCLLLGILTAYYFARAVETGSLKHRIGVFIFSILLFATGVEGVIFATLFILIYSAYHYRDAWKHKILYVWHFGGYVISLGILMIITWKANCLIRFLGTMFGFSKTITPLFVKLYTWINYMIYGEIVEMKIPSGAVHKGSFFQSVADGLTINIEYLILIGVAIILFACLAKKLTWKNIQRSTWIAITMAIVSPFVYILAGRYVLYYTWAAYIPCIISITMLAEQFKHQWIHFGAGVLMALWFCVDTGPMITRNIYHARECDRKNIENIAKAQINPDIPTCIPYSWYYYVIEDNENVWFQGSGAFPEDLSVLICDKSMYSDRKLMDMFVLRERCRIGDKIVYDVLSRKEE